LGKKKNVEKKREEFRVEKDRLEEVMKNKTEEILKRYQNERQRMIDRQYEHLLDLPKKCRKDFRIRKAKKIR